MTPERYRKIKQVLEQRQPDLTVVMENVHKAHNLAAIARTCDAVGVGQIHAVTESDHIALTQDAASGSGRWVDVQTYSNITTVYKHLKKAGFAILTAHFNKEAVYFREIDYKRPTAIVVGQELDGISDEAVDGADQNIIIPMHGMVQSLNVSVATALILYEAQHQRLQAGMYQKPAYGAEKINNIIFEKGYPRLAASYRKNRTPYPKLDDNGQIINR